MRRVAIAVVTALAGVGAFSASADNLEKLSAFQKTGVTEFTFVEQGGANAEAIKKTLARIKVPAGFMMTPEGEVTPIPGGPQDPQTLSPGEAKERLLDSKNLDSRNRDLPNGPKKPLVISWQCSVWPLGR